MKKIIKRILPTTIDNNYEGSNIAKYFFIVIVMAGIVRSLIHLLAPDGGANSIAGIDLNVTGAEGIIFAFSLWGGAQLIYGIIELIVYLKYKKLIPLMYIIMIIEILLRMFTGLIKPITFDHVPPGQIGNYILIIVLPIMLYFSLRSKK